VDQQARLNQPAENPIIFFDGVCNLCNASVQFILKRDHTQVFLFAPLQGETFATLNIPEKEKLPDSIILLENGKLYAESDAVLHIARRLSLPWRYLALPGWLFPRFVRDPIYRLIARNRYRWFGKKDACYLPTSELKARFLP
jgi:predicted DCC family thiol-disulfide oxidoreductase YuxK